MGLTRVRELIRTFQVGHRLKTLSPAGMAELASLVQRLEVAVGRLESMSGSGGSAGVPSGGGKSEVLTQTPLWLDVHQGVLMFLNLNLHLVS